MKRIAQAIVLVFSVSLLIGCDEKDKPSTPPATPTPPELKLEEVAGLNECTDPQKKDLDPGPGLTLAGNNPNDVGGGLCVHVDEYGATEADIIKSFERLRDTAVRGNRGSCKWTYRDGFIEQLWYCSPQNVAEEGAQTGDDN